MIPKTTQNKSDLIKWGKGKEFSKEIQNLSYRNLTLKHLRELIEEICEGKKAFDLKCHEQKVSQETLEQYMYYHFKYKYGLNNMIIEWVFAVIEGVRNYASKDVDVAAFGMVG